jgi:translocation and assembly module TamB
MQAVMQLTGLASEPALTLTSDPVLPQDEILARLIFNRSLAKMSVFQIAQLASAVAELSGRSQTDLIENLRRIAGVDNFDIRTSETGATSGAVGKYLDDNLYSEVEVDTEGKTNITINLDLSETLSLQGSVDNEGSGGLGLLFEKDY